MIKGRMTKTFKFKNIRDLLKKVFPTEQSCIKHLEERRWKGNIVSPFDPASKVYECVGNKYKCKNTGKYFNAKTGTIFESSKIKLQDWFLALYLFSSHKKGISSYQLAKYMGITQKSAWFVEHRLRHASDLSLFKDLLRDCVEIDEAFIGGSNPNRHWNKKVPKTQGRNWKDKIPVWGAIEKDGNLIARVVPNTKKRTLKPIIEAYVKKNTNVYTDEWLAYWDLGKWFNHQIVNHRKKQYVNGEATTNRIENAWSHLKRLINTYQQISRKHAQKYIDEFTLRFNTRKYEEQERFDLLLASTVGKRLTYRELINHC